MNEFEEAHFQFVLKNKKKTVQLIFTTLKWQYSLTYYFETLKIQTFYY